jgi:hypothetical protein
MKTTIELNDLRKLIKAIGYKVETKRLSFGRSATYIHIATGERLTGNVFTSETLKTWQPLLDLLKANPATEVMDRDDKVYGHMLK